MPKATLLREFGPPDLVARKRPKQSWCYVMTPHIPVRDEKRRMLTDFAYLIAVHGGIVRFDGCNCLSKMFYETHSNQSAKWWRFLRPRMVA